jgi:hypothetical protein
MMAYSLLGDAALLRSLIASCTTAAAFGFITPIPIVSQLGGQGYADVIAFILATDGFSNGQGELPANEQALESIMIEKKK